MAELLAHQEKWALVRQSGNLLTRDTIIDRHRVELIEAVNDEAMGGQIIVHYDSTRHSLFQKRYFVIDQRVSLVETGRVDTTVLTWLNPRTYLWEIETYYFSKKKECSRDVRTLFIDQPTPTKRDSAIMNSGYNERLDNWDMGRSLCQDVLELNEFVLDYAQ